MNCLTMNKEDARVILHNKNLKHRSREEERASRRKLEHQKRMEKLAEQTDDEETEALRKQASLFYEEQNRIRDKQWNDKRRKYTRDIKHLKMSNACALEMLPIQEDISAYPFLEKDLYPYGDYPGYWQDNMHRFNLLRCEKCGSGFDLCSVMNAEGEYIVRCHNCSGGPTKKAIKCSSCDRSESLWAIYRGVRVELKPPKHYLQEVDPCYRPFFNTFFPFRCITCTKCIPYKS